jgi:hypothetical protein
VHWEITKLNNRKVGQRKKNAITKENLMQEEHLLDKLTIIPVGLEFRDVGKEMEKCFFF